MLQKQNITKKGTVKRSIAPTMPNFEPSLLRYMGSLQIIEEIIIDNLVSVNSRLHLSGVGATRPNLSR